MLVIILAICWIILTAWVIGVILAAELEPDAAAARADPYARDVAAFRAELADWDRRGRP